MPNVTLNDPTPPQTVSGSGSPKFRIGAVASVVQALLDDPGGMSYDDGYCKRYIQIAWDDVSGELTQLGLNYEEDVEILNVSPGTTDLSLFQADGGQLAAMLIPTFLQWKYPTEADTGYRAVPYKDRLPDVDTTANGVYGYEWRRGTIFVTPSSQAVMVRVRFKTFTLDFADLNDQVIVGAKNIIAYRTVATICSPMVRNNAPAYQAAMAAYKEALDNFEAMAIKNKQRQVHRFGRMSGRGRRTAPVAGPSITT